MTMAEVEIVLIHNDPSGVDQQSKLNDEYIVIKNKSSRRLPMTGCLVSDRTPTGQDTHLFRFPPTIGNSLWTLGPGEYIFLMTGTGTNAFIQGDSTHDPQFHFYMQHRWFVWNNQGDTAFLRLPNGEFIHTMKVP
jgi:hypothetical protein